jgi:hypothetical protein
MSQANSAARKRRAGGASFEPQNPQQAPRAGQVPGQGPSAGLTLPQVIAVVDARLIKLETFMKETQTHAQMPNKSVVQQVSAPAQAQVPESYLSEFDDKFEVLANEIADLKDIVLKLQSYTMDVNKMLMEERINVLSDMGETEMTLEPEPELEHAPVSSKKEVTFNLTNVNE